MLKCFVVDVTYDQETVKTYLFNYADQKDLCQEFCANVRAMRGSVNIRIRDIAVPD